MQDRIAIVTGGGSGIGRALALELGRLGPRVAVTDLDERAAIAVAEAIASSGGGGRATAHRLDVTRADEVRALIDEIAAREGRIDLLFNNAGIAVAGEAQLLSI